MNHECKCRRLLAHFFDRTRNIRAHWFPILLEESQRSSSSSEFGLHTLLGLDYELYITLMKKCGLIHNMKSNRSGTLMDVPSINNGKFNKLGYTWSDFLAEYQLTFIEVAYICTKSGKKIYYV